jgi:hypothetical protein
MGTEQSNKAPLVRSIRLAVCNPRSLRQQNWRECRRHKWGYVGPLESIFPMHVMQSQATIESSPGQNLKKTRELK